MINLESISKNFGSSSILNNVSLTINEKHRTGLVGINGSGKTTLLRMLSGNEPPDRGIIHKPADLTLGFLQQEVEVLEPLTPLQVVLEPFAHLLNFEETFQELAGKVASDTREGKKALDNIGHLHDQMALHDGFSLQSRAEAILSGLGIARESWNKPVRALSGGFRMRATLGKLLLQSPGYMLLDEPTNHLDMDSLIWLERFLSRYQGGMIIVSHDRDFLNRMTDSTVEIGRGTLIIYKGNYDSYLHIKEEADIAARSRAKNLETRITQTERFVERFKAKATKASQAQSRMKLLDVLRAELPDIERDSRSMHFKFPMPGPSGAVPLRLKSVAVGYGGAPVLSGLSLDVNRGDKVAIVGPNGAGKSTLLKTLAGLVTPVHGAIEPGHNTTIRYFGQHQLEQLDPEKTLIETVAQTSVSTEKTFIRNVLGAFLFSGDAVEKQVKVLSGGEKSRLVLATILASPGNVLLLDEPTNHLDLQSIEVLADAMAEYAGTIVFVSHDDYFVSKIATRIIEMRPGLFRDFPGRLADYRRYLEAVMGNIEQPQSATKNGNTATPQDQSRNSRIREREERKKLGRAIEKIEREIESRESESNKLHSILHNPENALNYELLHETNAQLETHKKELESLLSRWEHHQTELESDQ